MRLLLLLALLLLAPLTSRAQDVWPQLSDTVTGILEERAEENWSSFGKPADSARARRIERLKTTALKILGESDATRMMTRLEDIRKETAAERQKLADLKVQRASAPEQVKVEGLGDVLKMLTTRTRSDFDRTVRASEARLAELDGERDRVKDDLVAGLARIGIRLERNELDSLLSTVTADDIVAMHAVYLNLRTVGERLRKAVDEAGESVETARRYYGLHAVLVEIVLTMHESFAADIATYRQRLKGIEEEARKLREQTQAMLRARPEEHQRRILQGNLEAHDLTLNATRAYDAYLARQQDEAQAARSRMLRELDVALNTWRTVRLSSQLVEMMRSQSRDLDTLMSIRLPPLRQFEGQDLRREMERLNDRIMVPGS